ncbi:MAG: sulfite exporter TauE/SafE family protein [Sneathiella sp.]|nr:sulfite exporter TauE/SafE family protein [Sneathiella sp.]
MIDQVINEFNGAHFALICAGFLIGGLVKGISSFGLPTVSIPIILFVLPLPSAVSILALPLILSNFAQMISAGGIKASTKRHWPLLLPLLIGLPFGVYFLAIVNTQILTIVLGAVLILITSLELMGISLTFLKQHERVFGPVIGATSGVIGGMTSLFGIIPIFFLVSLDLSKEKFVSVVSVLLFSGSVVLAVSLERSALLGPLEAFYGLAGMVPIMFGIWVGTLIRKRVDQLLFRKIILSLILIVGISMIYRNFEAISFFSH